MRSGHYPLIVTAEYYREFLDYQELFHEKHEIPMENVSPPRTVSGWGRRAHNKIRLIARTPIDLDRAQQDRVDIEHEPLSAA